MGALLANDTARKALAVIGLLMMLAAAFFYFRHSERDVGRAEEKAKQTEQVNTIQKRIDDAAANGPRTPGDVNKRLRGGSF